MTGLDLAAIEKDYALLTSVTAKAGQPTDAAFRLAHRTPELVAEVRRLQEGISKWRERALLAAVAARSIGDLGSEREALDDLALIERLAAGGS